MIKPVISIGLPVYNEGSSIEDAILCLLEQTIQNIEIIISDNASDDITTEICQKYINIDKRIKYVRQKENIGIANNFIEVFKRSEAEYFKWHAGDDCISRNFLEMNYIFLQKNRDYVASTSPNIFSSQRLTGKMVDFSLEGNFPDRIIVFLDYCFKSHGIFYSLIKREVLLDCNFLKKNSTFFAHDWAIILHLLSKGKIHRTKDGCIIFGENGISQQKSAYRNLRSHNIEYFLPFYFISKYIIMISWNFSTQEKINIYKKIAGLNLHANRCRIKNYFFK